MATTPDGTRSTFLEGYLADGTLGYRGAYGYLNDASYVSHAHGWSTGPTSALKGLDTGAPIDVDAARIEVQNADNQAIFTGDVVIRQGKLTLKADTVKVLYVKKPNGDPEMQRLDARGTLLS